MWRRISGIGKVRDDPKPLGDSREVPISEWSGWRFNSLLWNLLSTWRKKTIPRAHNRKVGNEPHPGPIKFLSRLGLMGSNSCWIVQCWLFIYLFGIGMTTLNINNVQGCLWCYPWTTSQLWMQMVFHQSGRRLIWLLIFIWVAKNISPAYERHVGFCGQF